MGEGHNKSNQQLIDQEPVEKEDNIGDLYQEALKSGFPTFEQFKKDPTCLRKIQDSLLQSMDRGQTLIDNVPTQKYFFKTRGGMKYECASLEKLQDIADQEGVPVGDLVIETSELRQEQGGKYSLECVIKDGRSSVA